MNVKKTDILKVFRIEYYAFTKGYKGYVSVTKDGLDISGETPFFKTLDGATKAAQELLIKIYVKAEN
jgi:hypothetical protein